MTVTVGLRTSLIFCWRESDAFFSPLSGFHYRNALGFIEFTLNIECMVFWIRAYFITAIRTQSKIEVFLATGCKCVGSIYVFLKYRIKYGYKPVNQNVNRHKKYECLLTATWSIFAPSPVLTEITFDSIFSSRFDIWLLSDAAFSIRDATLASSFIRFLHDNLYC